MIVISESLGYNIPSIIIGITTYVILFDGNKSVRIRVNGRHSDELVLSVRKALGKYLPSLSIVSLDNYVSGVDDFCRIEIEITNTQ